MHRRAGGSLAQYQNFWYRVWRSLVQSLVLTILRTIYIMSIVVVSQIAPVVNIFSGCGFSRFFTIENLANFNSLWMSLSCKVPTCMTRENVKSIKDSNTTMTTTTGYTLLINPMTWQFTMYIAQSPAIKLVTYKGSCCAYQTTLLWTNLPITCTEI